MGDKKITLEGLEDAYTFMHVEDVDDGGEGSLGGQGGNEIGERNGEDTDDGGSSEEESYRDRESDGELAVVPCRCLRKSPTQSALLIYIRTRCSSILLYCCGLCSPTF